MEKELELSSVTNTEEELSMNSNMYMENINKLMQVFVW